MKLVVASNNAGKLREFQALLAPLGYTLVTQSELGIGEAEEPYPSFVENALTKARHASRLSGLPALADDSGLCVEALQGRPGVHSARFAQETPGEPRSDSRNNAKLIQLLQGQAQRAAYYVSVLAMVRSADDPMPLLGEGVWRGEIIDEPRGDGGFGYDPHFWVPTHACTAAQLPPEEKNRISHRALALAQLRVRLAALG